MGSCSVEGEVVVVEEAGVVDNSKVDDGLGIKGIFTINSRYRV